MNAARLHRAWLRSGRVHRRLGVALLAALAAGCATTPPANPENLCAIFEERPKWHRAAQRAEQRWSVPIPVMMAVMHKESSYVADARPPRRRLLGIVPWTRLSDAYGFAQATDAAWLDYRRHTGNRRVRRDDFHDAVDFVGWYLDWAHQRAGIPTSDAYSLYLAYYAGIGGYQRGVWRNNAWLKGAAQRVQSRSSQYARQLAGCRLDRRR